MHDRRNKRIRRSADQYDYTTAPICTKRCRRGIAASATPYVVSVAIRTSAFLRERREAAPCRSKPAPLVHLAQTIALR